MTTTNFTNGVTTADVTTTLGSFIAPDPTKAHTFWDDFDAFSSNIATTPAVPGDWTLTTTGSGTALVTDADNGVVLVTNGASDDNNVFCQWCGRSSSTSETFKWDATKPMWFKARFQVSDATQSDLIIGLAITDTSPLDASDGIFFLKSDGSASVSLKAVKNSTASTVAVGTLTDATYYTVGFAWLPNGPENGAGGPGLYAFFNDVQVGSITSTTNMPDDEELAITFGIQNGEAVAKTMSLDYILCSKVR
jgi:hypothetical protein